MDNQKEYTKNPEDIKFDTKIVEFNPKKDATEYQALKSLIESHGQQRPIIVRNGLCVDGRHRVQIAKELGIQVSCIDIPAATRDKECLILANLDTIGARNDSSTQKAFKVVTMVTLYGYTQAEAMTTLGIKNKNDVIAAKFILNNPLYKDAYYEPLAKGESITITHNGAKVYTGKSLRRVKQELAAIEEKDLLKNKPETVKVVIDYNELIHTETARKEFWLHIGTKELPVETKEWAISLLNAVYKLEDK